MSSAACVLYRNAKQVIRARNEPPSVTLKLKVHQTSSIFKLCVEKRVIEFVSVITGITSFRSSIGEKDRTQVSFHSDSIYGDQGFYL